VLRSALPVLYPRCTLALAGLLVSNTSFVLAALALYWLGCLTLRDGDLALRAAYLFCFNPASVFFSGVYTEAVFAFISWAGALSLVVDSPWRAALAFSTAAATRSNGEHPMLREDAR
jgi:phosphatidylinositol glycan class V